MMFGNGMCQWLMTPYHSGFSTSSVFVGGILYTYIRKIDVYIDIRRVRINTDGPHSSGGRSGGRPTKDPRSTRVYNWRLSKSCCYWKFIESKNFYFFPRMHNDNGLTTRLRDVYYACHVIRYRRTKLNIKLYSLKVR